MNVKKFGQLITASALMFSVQTTMAADHTVNAVGVKFDPPFLIVQPGDTVSFTNMSGHLVETIDSLVPEGQEKVTTNMGENVNVTFDVPGVVAYKCTPHWGARMGGLILVGEPDNPQGILDQYMTSIADHPENLPAKGLIKKFTKFLQENGKI